MATIHAPETTVPPPVFDAEGYTEWLLAEAYAEAIRVLGYRRAHAVIMAADLEHGQ